MWLRAVCAVTGIVGAAALGWVSAQGLSARGVAAGGWVALGVWLCILAVLFVLLHSRADERRMEFVFWWGAVYMVLDNAVINALKLVWGRTRFDDMLAQGDFTTFTHWFSRGNGGSSCPSGHTAAACGIFVLVLLCDVFPAWQRRRGWAWAVCWAYIGTMALCRVAIGRHFLTDTLVAAFVMTLLLFAMRSSKPYCRGFARLMEEASSGAKGAGTSAAQPQRGDAAPEAGPAQGRKSTGETDANEP